MIPIEKILDEFRKRKILVIGDIILDKFSLGEVERINPEQRAAPLVKILKETYALGGAANVANNVSSLGADCYLYGTIGNGVYGKKLEKLCEEKKIKLRIFYNENPPIVKQRVIAHGQHIARLDFGEEKLEKLNIDIQNKILNSLKNEINSFDFIILSDYNKSLFDENLSREIINMANLHNIPVLVDTKPSNLNFFKNCTIICPNKHEAEEMTKVKYTGEEDILTKMGEILCEKACSKYAIVTCGKDGMFGYDKNEKKAIFIKTKVKEIGDVTGAGDTFAAIFALCMASKLSMYDSAKLANYAAGIVVGKVGTSVVTINEFMNLKYLY